MKRIITSLAAVVMALAADAQGITSVGANIPVLPSVRWSNEAYTAKTWVINANQDYEMDPSYYVGGSPTNSPQYNKVLQVPSDDANGKKWYEEGYDEATSSASEWDEGEFINWEEKTAPYSSDATYNGLPSYQWATNDKTADIYIRRTFSTELLLSGDVYLACGHDDAPCEYYLNGTLIWSKTGFEIDRMEDVVDEETGEVLEQLPVYKQGWNNDEVYKLTDEQKALIRLGGEENLLAVHVHQNWGGAYADCGLYTMVQGGLPMGYIEPWDGKVIFNAVGGYNQTQHNWERLYEAQPGDVYTVHMEGSSEPLNEEGEPAWNSRLEFKSPLKLAEDHEYTVKFTLEASCHYSDVRVKFCENDNNSLDIPEDVIDLGENEPQEYEAVIDGIQVNNLKICLDLAGGEAGSIVKISGMSVYDETEGKELWVGTHYFNHFGMTKTSVNEETGETVVEGIASPVVEGRTETMAWTLPDFDDEMWDTWKMPVGNLNYMPEVQTEWPGGDNTNLWVRRNFELDKVNERLSYALNVCHDDNYETYINGHLLQKGEGWTDGKGTVQVHIPASYLRVGRNVIATYIQQNWGGKFYDCGINVEEVNYDECADALKAVLAKAEGEHPELTRAMADSLATLAAAGRHELETNMDAAEMKEYAKVLGERVNELLGYAYNVGVVRQTVALCEKENKGFITEALADVAANIDTCVTAGQMDPMLTALRVARKRNSVERRAEKFTGTTPEANGEYYFYNVGEKLFLGGGESWGAHAAVEYVSNTFALINTNRVGEPLPEGHYRIQTFRSNGTTGEGWSKDFLNYGGYVDTSTDDAFEFLPVEGKPNVYLIARASSEYEETDENGNIVVKHSNVREDGSRYLLGMRGDNANYVGFNQWNVIDTDTETPSLETNQWMLISADEMDSFMAEAKSDKGVDVSHLLANPGYDQRLDVDGSWLCLHEDGGTGVWGRGDDHVDFVYEGWNTKSFDLFTSVFDLLPGWYEVRVQGYYRDGHYTTHLRELGQGQTPAQYAYLYALPHGGYRLDGAEDIVTKQLTSFTDGMNRVPGMGRKDDFTIEYTDEEGNTQTYTGPGTRYLPDACWSAAEEFFQNGLYWNSMWVYVPEGSQEFTFGVYKDDSNAQAGDWVVVDNWRLIYYGNNGQPTGIGSVVADGEATAEGSGIFNLSGQKLQKVQKGVNIVNGRKVVVK